MDFAEEIESESEFGKYWLEFNYHKTIDHLKNPIVNKIILFS